MAFLGKSHLSFISLSSIRFHHLDRFTEFFRLLSKSTVVLLPISFLLPSLTVELISLLEPIRIKAGLLFQQLINLLVTLSRSSALHW